MIMNFLISISICIIGYVSSIDQLVRVSEVLSCVNGLASELFLDSQELVVLGKSL
jgi:uncharacterized membrane protein